MIRPQHYFTKILTIKMSTNKSFSTETAERYSRALFEVVEDSKELDRVESEIKNFQKILVNNLEIENFIKDPTRSKKTQSNVVSLLAEKLGFSKNLKNFFLLLVEK